MVNKVVTPATREQTSAVLWPRPPLDYVCITREETHARLANGARSHPLTFLHTKKQGESVQSLLYTAKVY